MEGVGPECPRRVLVFSWWIFGELLAFDRVLVTVVTSTSKDVPVKQRDLFSGSIRKPKEILGVGELGKIWRTLSTPR